MNPTPIYILGIIIALGIAAALTFYQWRHYRATRGKAPMPVAYDQIVSSVQDAVLVLNAEAYIMGFNPAAERLLKVQREQLRNSPLSSVLTLPPDTPLSGESRAEFEYPIGDMICEIDSLPLLNGGTVIGRILVLRDISARKQAERETLALAFERERAHILSMFIRDASHEFRTPVTVIKTSLYLLTRQTDPEKRAKHIVTIDMQIGRLSRLIEDLQKMSVLDSQPELQRVETALHPFLGELWGKFEAQADNRLMKIVMDESPLVVNVDPLELEQGLTRVIDNAIRYSPPDSVIELRAIADGEWLRLEIQDHGIGMDADTLKKATQRFYRNDHAHSTAGFGLGLPIAKTIIELHGGTLSLDSVIEEGTTVIIRLPLSTQRENRPHAVELTH